MIRNQWYAIIESNEVPKGRPVGFTRLGEKMVAWRDATGRVTVMSDLCPHRGVALSVGKLVGGCLQCPFHGFEYDASGACRLIPANGRVSTPPKAFQVRTFPSREEHNFIYVWYGEPRPDLPPVPFFDAIDEKNSSYLTVRDHWATHYSRAIENQLDVVHLPFIHYNTIGRGNRTLVNGPQWKLTTMESCSDLLELWVDNQIDQGQAPLKPSQMPAPTRRPFLQFRFPNVWHNWISDQMHIFLAFAPIDEENTLMYIRMYQSMVKLPLLREFFNLTGAIGNLVIERQDKRVVITQQPKRTDLRMGEKLIPGDGPIVEYRRRRLELQESSESAQTR